MLTPEHKASDSVRDAAVAQLGSTEYDLLIVGGGITGAGVARDAAMRGLRVALVDKGEFGGGTSSKSSKLIHGGLRYLEHGHLRLVRESSRERAILLRIAPHLVKPLRFTWPVYRGARIPKWKLNVGLKLYDMLAKYQRSWKHESLDAREVIKNEPSLRRSGLLGGATYFDAMTDDRKLTLANIESARNAGAEAVENILVESAKSTGSGFVVRSAKLEIFAKVVVNATGPWRADLLQTNSPQRVQRGTKGAHITLPREKIGNTDAITLLSAIDGRVMFVLPWDDRTIIGTTDTWTNESPDEVSASAEDIDYLLRSVRPYFPDCALSRSDVTGSWAGIRPLAAGTGTGDPAKISREHTIEEPVTGMFVISGGKLTTYRSMAAEIVDRVELRIRGSVKRAPTDLELLP
jgi:glycerol-3-phosphate dehydrogenase